MIAVYKLEQDKEDIANVQKATLETESFGLQQTHGLFGSDTWWGHIRDGSLPVHTVRGTISKTWMGAMRDVPECEVVTETGEKTTWTRYAEDRWYRVGNPIEIDYVIQTLKEAAAKHLDSAEHKIVIEVRIGEQPSRPSRLKGLLGKIKLTRNRRTP